MVSRPSLKRTFSMGLAPKAAISMVLMFLGISTEAKSYFGALVGFLKALFAMVSTPSIAGMTKFLSVATRSLPLSVKPVILLPSTVKSSSSQTPSVSLEIFTLTMRRIFFRFSCTVSLEVPSFYWGLRDRLAFGRKSVRILRYRWKRRLLCPGAPSCRCPGPSFHL